MKPLRQAHEAPAPEANYLTISQFNELVRDVLMMGFPNAVWVCGEIQGYNRNKDKTHIFFDLCEKDPESKDIVARIGVVIFANRKAYLKELLASCADAFQLKDDIEVKFLCRVDFYPPHGAVRLIVEGLDPTFTLGKIAQEKQRLIAKLTTEGILEKNKQLSLPAVPLRVGLITAYDSAAYNDFLSELRHSGFAFRVFFRNALMQGKGLEKDVCRALEELDRPGFLDVIVITRGGGSLADLSWFDNEPIARRMAACRIPVLSGIGHEINITITDLAAHTHQKTPTAIARFLVQSVEDFLTGLEEKGRHLATLARQQLDRQKSYLKHAALTFQSCTQDYLKIHEEKVIRYKEILNLRPPQVLSAAKMELRRIKDLLLRSSGAFVKSARERIRHGERMVELAHPDNTLRRGFSITRTGEGKAVRSIQEVGPGEEITTVVADGHFDSRIQTIKKEEKRGRREIQQSG